MITSGAVHHFGNQDESMSGVIGKNKKTKSLTRLGKWVASVLNAMGSKHVENAIEVGEE